MGGTAMPDWSDAYTGEYTESWRNIVLGRVFTFDEAMHFVLEVDETTSLCRVSRRQAGRTEIVQMPLTEVVMHVKGDV